VLQTRMSTEYAAVVYTSMDAADAASLPMSVGDSGVANGSGAGDIDGAGEDEWAGGWGHTSANDCGWMRPHERAMVVRPLPQLSPLGPSQLPPRAALELQVQPNARSRVTTPASAERKTPVDATNDANDANETGALGAELDAQFAQWRPPTSMAAPTQASDGDAVSDTLAMARLDEQFEMWARGSADSKECTPPNALPATSVVRRSAPSLSSVVPILSEPPPAIARSARRALVYDS
jgi:hypothetical protein